MRLKKMLLTGLTLFCLSTTVLTSTVPVYANSSIEKNLNKKKTAEKVEKAVVIPPNCEVSSKDNTVIISGIQDKNKQRETCDLLVHFSDDADVTQIELPEFSDYKYTLFLDNKETPITSKKTLHLNEEVAQIKFTIKIKKGEVLNQTRDMVIYLDNKKDSTVEVLFNTNINGEAYTQSFSKRIEAKKNTAEVKKNTANNSNKEKKENETILIPSVNESVETTMESTAVEATMESTENNNKTNSIIQIPEASEGAVSVDTTSAETEVQEQEHNTPEENSMIKSFFQMSGIIIVAVGGGILFWLFKEWKEKRES